MAFLCIISSQSRFLKPTMYRSGRILLKCHFSPLGPILHAMRTRSMWQFWASETFQKRLTNALLTLEKRSSSILHVSVFSRRPSTLEVWGCHVAQCRSVSSATRRGQSLATALHVESWVSHLRRNIGSTYGVRKRLLEVMVIVTLPRSRLWCATWLM
jgi:hypothetical protein